MCNHMQVLKLLRYMALKGHQENVVCLREGRLEKGERGNAYPAMYERVRSQLLSTARC